MKKMINQKTGFSLMEMMVVLLIISIVAAATAPMISKKLARNAAQSDNPWVYPNLGNNIAYNMGGKDDRTAIIGAANAPNANNANNSKLYIQSDGETNHPLIAFGTNGVTNRALRLIADVRDYDSTNNKGARVGISDENIPAGTVALGTYQIFDNNTRGGVNIGVGSQIGSGASVAVGTNVYASGENSIAIGGSVTTAFRFYVKYIRLKQLPMEQSYHLGEEGKYLTVDAETERIAEDKIPTIIQNEETEDKVTRKITSIVRFGSVLGANAIGNCSIAIGRHAMTSNDSSIALSTSALSTSGENATAIGANAGAYLDNATAIGANARATRQNSTAIGAGAKTTQENQIVLGTPSDTVYIPGNIVVMGNVLLGGNGNSRVYVNLSDGTGIGIARLTSGTEGQTYWDGVVKANSGYTGETLPGFGYGITQNGTGIGSNQLKDGDGNTWFTSDRRLKNVGDKFKGGLEELKMLDLYNFTFKKDEKKTPQVGVMAQDLQKVFPTAVIEGEDGYLRIRWDEMFYAVINAVKELDTKITAVVEQVKAYTDKVNKLEETISAQQKTIDEQQKAINELKKNNADFEKRLAKLEKKIK